MMICPYNIDFAKKSSEQVIDEEGASEHEQNAIGENDNANKSDVGTGSDETTQEEHKNSDNVSEVENQGSNNDIYESEDNDQVESEENNEVGEEENTEDRNGSEEDTGGVKVWNEGGKK